MSGHLHIAKTGCPFTVNTGGCECELLRTGQESVMQLKAILLTRTEEGGVRGTRPGRERADVGAGSKKTKTLNNNRTGKRQT